MDPISILNGIGLGVASNFVYDVIKRNSGSTHEQLRAATQNELNLRGINMQADTVINALVQNGMLTITGSHLFAKDGLAFGSVHGGAIFGNSSSMSTSRTGIVANGNAAMVTQGNAQVRQNPDGSISFHVGEGDSTIKFVT